LRKEVIFVGMWTAKAKELLKKVLGLPREIRK
jgi:hypothetical protein